MIRLAPRTPLPTAKAEIVVVTKLLFVGDPHGRVPQIADYLSRDHCDAAAVVFLGDMELAGPFEEAIAPLPPTMQVAFIPGNHDYANAVGYDRLFRYPGRAVNLDGDVITLGRTRVAGLGGHFRAKIWYPPNPPKFSCRNDYRRVLRPTMKSGTPASWRDEMPLHASASIWLEDLERMGKEIRADILVSHEAPSTHAFGFEEIDTLADALGVREIVHGHQHQRYESSLPSAIRVFGVDEGEILVGSVSDTGTICEYTRISSVISPRS